MKNFVSYVLVFHFLCILCIGKCEGQLDAGYYDLRTAVKLGLGYDVQEWQILRFRGKGYDLLRRFEVIDCSDRYGNKVVLRHMDNHYCRLNCPNGLRYINEVLRGYLFEEADYTNRVKFRQLVSYIKIMYASACVFVVSGKYPFNSEQISDYLNEPNQIFIDPNKSKINEQKLKIMFCDPTITKEGKYWKIHFNAITLREGMQSWLIYGEHNKKDKFLQINKVVIEDIEPAGTIKFPCPTIFYVGKDELPKKEKPYLMKKARAGQEDLLAVIEEYFQDYIGNMYILENTFDWIKKESYVSASNFRHGDVLSCLYKDGCYFQFNCKEGIPYINMLLLEYHFEREDFKNPVKVAAFLRDLVHLYSSRYYICAFPGLLKELKENNIKVFNERLWQQYKKKNTEEHLSPIKKPVFVFTDDNWEVEFNVFNDRRGFDRWTVSGIYDPLRKVNQITNIKLDKTDEDITFLPDIRFGIWGEEYW